MSGPLGGQPGWTRTFGKGKKRFITKGIKIGSYVVIAYRVPSKLGHPEEAADYEGKIVDKRVGSDDRESYVELKDCLRLNAKGQVVAKEKMKRLFDAYIEDCKVAEKREVPPEIVPEDPPEDASAGAASVVGVEASIADQGQQSQQPQPQPQPQQQPLQQQQQQQQHLVQQPHIAMAQQPVVGCLAAPTNAALMQPAAGYMPGMMMPGMGMMPMSAIQMAMSGMMPMAMPGMMPGMVSPTAMMPMGVAMPGMMPMGMATNMWQPQMAMPTATDGNAVGTPSTAGPGGFVPTPCAGGFTAAAAAAARDRSRSPWRA